MSKTTLTLKLFNKNELIINAQQTRDILKFFFPADTSKIDVCPITHNTKNFAQGLLVEAIDATYKLGFVQALWETFISPAKYQDGILKLIKSFAKKAIKHWFKHATAADLADVKIYEAVRAVLSRNFRSYVNIDILAQTDNRVMFIAFIDDNEYKTA